MRQEYMAHKEAQGLLLTFQRVTVVSIHHYNDLIQPPLATPVREQHRSAPDTSWALLNVHQVPAVGLAPAASVMRKRHSAPCLRTVRAAREGGASDQAARE